MHEKKFNTSFLGKDYPLLYITEDHTAVKVIEILQASDCEIFGLDTETAALSAFRNNREAGLDPHQSRMRLLQISDGESLIVFDLLYLMKYTNAYAAIKSFLADKKFVAHNAIFDLQFLLKEFELEKIDIHCTYILWKIISHATTINDSGLKASLAALAENLLKTNMFKELQVSDWSEPDLTFEQIEYAGFDALATLLIFKKVAPSVVKLGCAKYYKLLKAAQIPIARMQLNGIGFDVNNHAKLCDVWLDDLYKARVQLESLTGLSKITPHSIAAYLEKNLSSKLLSYWPRTEEGKLMCDAHTLLDFYDSDPMIATFAIYQKKEKLCTSFGHNLIRMINPVTGRLHAKYNLCGARTGRLSCSNPNLQQLPRDVAVRTNFRAIPGSTLVCADYSQIELRVGAQLSQDEAMLTAYRRGVDLHSLTAAVVSKKKLSAITKADRQIAKAFNFGLMFGLGPTKFSRYAKHSYNVEVSDEEAKASIKLWRDTYAGYHEWQKNQVEIGTIKGYVKTALGKVRRLDPENMYGASMNTPVQGSACECMLAALVGIQNAIDQLHLKAKLCNTVHDEIIVECPYDEAETVKEEIAVYMAQGFTYVFPTGITNKICEIGEGESWGSAKA